METNEQFLNNLENELNKKEQSGTVSFSKFFENYMKDLRKVKSLTTFCIDIMFSMLKNREYIKAIDNMHYEGNSLKTRVICNIDNKIYTVTVTPEK